jgi:photosystem II stability/assembly factor-like uncharacterized protein
VAGGFGSLLLFGQTTTTHRSVRDVTPSSTSSLQTGPYYALVIGNNNYKHLTKLKTAINDANAVAQLLRERYGFQTQVLLDADRNQILTALSEYRRILPENSNLLIYYAGHGHHDRDADEAYWLPVDALADNDANWISADDITSNVRAVPSSHILVISDSCYSGFIARDADAAINPQERNAYLAKMLRSKSRNLMSSGGDEPVADNGAPGHSVFAGAILDSLRQIEEDKFTAASLFQRFIQPRVGGRSDQLPEYSWIRKSGHDAGDFVFSRTPSHRSVENSPALDPAHRTFVVASALTVLSNGQECQLTAGDVITRLTDTPDADGTVDVSISASKKSDCAAGQTAAVKVTDLEEMYKHFQEQLESGLAELARSQSGPGVPAERAPVGTSGKNAAAATTLSSSMRSLGWAVGWNGAIVHTEDGGRNWQVQNSGTQEALFSVFFTLPSSGWVVGEGGTILHTDDGGNNWNPQNSGTNAYLFSVTFATRESGWAVGTGGTIVHNATGDTVVAHLDSSANPISMGGNWKLQHSGTEATLYSVAFATPQSGWVVGADGTILHTTNGGSDWRPQRSGTSGNLHSVVFVTPQSGWIVGYEGTILHTEDGGVNWKPQNSGTVDTLKSVAFVTSRSGWAVGDYGTILHTEDGGGTWKLQESGVNEDLNSVAFASPQLGLLTGATGTNLRPFSDSTFLRTEDGGGSWPRLNKMPGKFLTVAFVKAP